MMACLLPYNSGDASTLNAAAPAALTSLIAAVISSGLAMVKAKSSMPRDLTASCSAWSCRIVVTLESACAGHRLDQEVLPFAIEFGRENAHACRVAPRLSKRAREPFADHII